MAIATEIFVPNLPQKELSEALDTLTDYSKSIS